MSPLKFAVIFFKIFSIKAITLRQQLYDDITLESNVLDFEWINNSNHNYMDYTISVNGTKWLYSGPTMFRNNGQDVSSKVTDIKTENGEDNLGSYKESIVTNTDTSNNNIIMQTSVRMYDNPNILVFTQSFPNALRNTNVGSMDSVISSFPSFTLYNQSSDHIKLGYMHWSGGMAGGSPQYGQMNTEHSGSFKGGIADSGPIAIFNGNTASDLNNCIVIAPLTYAMTANDEIVTNKDGTKYINYGIQGGVVNIDAGFKISWIIVMTLNGGGVNAGMQYWGEQYLKYHNKSRNAHSRDFTLQWLGYGTDNGAYYFYYPIPNITYADTLIILSHNIM